MGTSKQIIISLTDREISALLWALENFEFRDDCWNHQTWAALRRIVQKVRKADVDNTVRKVKGKER